jgi:hypothetical protein
MTDQYSTNPLVDQLKRSQPAVHSIASRERPAPTMWQSGDLPALTASGADPAVLSQLPPGIRHLAASLPTRAALMALIDQQAGAPDGTIIRSPEWDAYAARVTAWGSGLHADADPVPAPTADDQDALVEAMFGEGGAGRMPAPPVADRVAEAAASNYAAAQERVRVSDEDWHRYQTGQVQA